MVRINGTEKDFAGKTVCDILTELRYDKLRVAVELNESILPKSQYESTVLSNDDKLEIVSFVGGG